MEMISEVQSNFDALFVKFATPKRYYFLSDIIEKSTLYLDAMGCFLGKLEKFRYTLMDSEAEMNSGTCLAFQNAVFNLQLLSMYWTGYYAEKRYDCNNIFKDQVNAFVIHFETQLKAALEDEPFLTPSVLTTDEFKRSVFLLSRITVLLNLIEILGWELNKEHYERVSLIDELAIPDDPKTQLTCLLWATDEFLLMPKTIIEKGIDAEQLMDDIKRLAYS